jgi:beta-glucosidase
VRCAAAPEAHEARYLYQSARFDRSGLIVRLPNADIVCDPRWGRTEEIHGEDPLHVGTLAVAFTAVLQDDDPRYWKTVSHQMKNSQPSNRKQSAIE